MVGADGIDELRRGFELDRESVLAAAYLLVCGLDRVVRDGGGGDERVRVGGSVGNGSGHLGRGFDTLDGRVGHVWAVVNERHLGPEDVASPRDRPAGPS